MGVFVVVYDGGGGPRRRRTVTDAGRESRRRRHRRRRHGLRTPARGLRFSVGWQHATVHRILISKLPLPSLLYES